jgi:hypothetical protein
MIEGMGHDLPRAAWSRVIEAIGENARGAEESEREARERAPAQASSPAG